MKIYNNISHASMTRLTSRVPLIYVVEVMIITSGCIVLSNAPGLFICIEGMITGEKGKETMSCKVGRGTK